MRGWLILIGYVFVALLFWGNLADLEHALAVVLVLFVDRSLRIQRATIREQRLLAHVSVLTLGAIEILTYLAPTDGLFGHTEPTGGAWWDLAIDIAIIVLIANGLRVGRRWAWVVTVILASLNGLTGILLVLAIAVLGADETASSLGSDPSVTLATSVLWLLLLVYVVWVRRAFRARPKSALGIAPAPSRDDVKESLRAHGGGTLSWMTTWEGIPTPARPPGL